MDRLTIRGVGEELGNRLRQISKVEGKSINSTVLELLEKAVGLSDRREWLNRFMTSTPSEVEEIDRDSRAQRTIDEKLWRNL